MPRYRIYVKRIVSNDNDIRTLEYSPREDGHCKRVADSMFRDVTAAIGKGVVLDAWMIEFAD